MKAATLGQTLIIDSRRGEECGHPRARTLALEFLSCKRCGTEFCDGRLRFIPVQLRAQDPPGETHNSSYAGDELLESESELVRALFDEPGVAAPTRQDRAP